MEKGPEKTPGLDQRCERQMSPWASPMLWSDPSHDPSHGLMLRLTDPAPLMVAMHQQRHRGVRCSRLVRLPVENVMPQNIIFDYRRMSKIIALSSGESEPLH